MKKKLLILTVALVAAAGLAVVVVISRTEPAEPQYDGKPLSYWLIKGLVPGEGNYDTDRKNAEAALAQFGTNAIPYLLRMLRARDSKYKLLLLAVEGKLHLTRRSVVPARLHNWAAAYALGQLRFSTRSMVPELIKVYQENISYDSRMATLFVLSRFGPTAIAATPTLLPGLTNTNKFFRAETVQTLGYIWATPKLAVPELAKCLTDPFARVRFNAAHVLGGYRMRAEAALPALIADLTDADPGVRTEVETAIMKINLETYQSLAEQGKMSGQNPTPEQK